ncbi:hypothetical protein Q0O09_10620, partial [Corynebacterium bovis]|nr:hypothetical protein [Corynebacterium bovis]
MPPKPLLSDGAGRRLIDRALAAAPRGGSVVVVGPPMPLPPHVHRVREDPPLSGPASALAAGVAALGGGSGRGDTGGQGGGRPGQRRVLPHAVHVR